MRATSTLLTAAALVGALLLSGCGSDEPKPRPAQPADATSSSAPTSGEAQSPQPAQPAPPARETGPMIPGDPGTAVKVLNRGKDAAGKLEAKSREAAAGDDEGK